MEGLIVEVNSEEVKRFERFCHVILGIGILFEKLTPEGVEFEKYFLHKMPLGLKISCKVCLLF